MPADEIKVATQLRNLHPSVAKTKDRLERLKAEPDGRLRLGRSGSVAMTVSRRQSRRALLVAQTIVREAERRGYEIKPVEHEWDARPGVGIAIKDQIYPFEIIEDTEAVPTTEAERAAWRKDHEWRIKFLDRDSEPPKTKTMACGRLRIKLARSLWSRGRRSTFGEGPRGPVEMKIDRFFAEIEARLTEDRERSKRQAIEAVERERLTEERLAAERLALIESKRIEHLERELARWRNAQDARAYVANYRERLPRFSDDDRERIERWLNWVDGRATQIERTIALSDDPAIA